MVTLDHLYKAPHTGQGTKFLGYCCTPLTTMASEVLRLLCFLLRAGYIWGQPEGPKPAQGYSCPFCFRSKYSWVKAGHQTGCVTVTCERILSPLPQRSRLRQENGGTVRTSKLCFENQFASSVKNTGCLTVPKLHKHLVESTSGRKKGTVLMDPDCKNIHVPARRSAREQLFFSTFC